MCLDKTTYFSVIFPNLFLNYPPYPSYLELRCCVEFLFVIFLYIIFIVKATTVVLTVSFYTFSVILFHKSTTHYIIKIKQTTLGLNLLYSEWANCSCLS